MRLWRTWEDYVSKVIYYYRASLPEKGIGYYPGVGGKVWGLVSIAEIEFINLFFAEFSDSTAKFYCRVYYADQFRQLRKIIFPAGEQRLVKLLYFQNEKEQ